MTGYETLRSLVADSNPVPGADHVDDAELAEGLFAIDQSWSSAESAGPNVRWSKAALVFAAAAAAILVLIGLPRLLSTDREADVSESATSIAPSTTVAPPTTAAAPPTTIGRVPPTTVPAAIVAPIPDISWRRVEVGGDFSRTGSRFLLENGEYGAITVVGSDLFIVGTVTDAGGGDADNRNAVWRSRDGGETWEEIDAGGMAEEATLAALAPSAAPDGTFVVAGSDADDAFVWATTDFEVWSKSESPDLGGRDFQGIYGIVHIDDRFVAVGEDGMDAAVWVSPDGLEWSQVLDEDFSAELIGEAMIEDIAPGRPGLVAVGSADASGSAGAASAQGDHQGGAIWVSSDGLEWDMLPFVDDPSGFGLASVSSDPENGRLIAFGGDWWVSDDGFVWAWFDRTVPLGGPPPGASAAWFGDVTVAGGWDATFSLWVSGDAGQTWHRVDPSHPEFEGCTQIGDVIAFGDRFIAVGPSAEDCWSDEWTATVWIGTTEE
jgi:hypothetical protein